jgi:hypothetical protein
MPNSLNDVFGLYSSMTAPLIQGGNVNAIMPQFDMYINSSTMGSPYIQGGYINVLLGIDRGAISQPAIKKLNFGGMPNEENMQSCCAVHNFFHLYYNSWYHVTPLHFLIKITTHFKDMSFFCMPHFPTTLYWFDTLLQFLEYSKMFL